MGLTGKNRPSRLLVTGCCGFIASHLVEKLCETGHTVTGIDWMKGSEERKIESLHILSEYENFRFIEGDINLDLPRDTFDFAFHLAAIPGVRGSIDFPIETMNSNVVGTTEIFDWARKGGCRNIIYASSSSVYGLNTKIPFSEEDTLNSVNSPYAASKLATEIIASTYTRLFPIKSVGLRFFTVYGPRGREDMAIHKFLNWVNNEEPLTVFGDGSTKRDYTFVDDIVDGITGVMGFMNNKMEYHSHEVFNLGNNKPVLLSELIEMVGKIVGKDPIIDRKSEQLGDVPITFANINKASELLSYEPKTSLKKGLKVTWDSMSEDSGN